MKSLVFSYFKGKYGLENIVILRSDCTSYFFQANAVRGVIAAVICAVCFVAIGLIVKFRYREDDDDEDEDKGKDGTGKGTFTLLDSTILYRTHDNLITYNNGLGPLMTKSPPYPPPWNPSPDFVLSVPNPLLKVIKLSCVRHDMGSSRS